jgi:hypothetical protein
MVAIAHQATLLEVIGVYRPVALGVWHTPRGRRLGIRWNLTNIVEVTGIEAPVLLKCGRRSHRRSHSVPRALYRKRCETTPCVYVWTVEQLQAKYRKGEYHE